MDNVRGLSPSLASLSLSDGGTALSPSAGGSAQTAGRRRDPERKRKVDAFCRPISVVKKTAPPSPLRLLTRITL